MKYLKMIEFLAGELARTEELLKSQSGANAKLSNTMIELEHWKEEALEYRNEIEPKWWAKEKELYQELEKAKEINDKYNIEVLHEQSDLVAELEGKVGSLTAENEELKSSIVSINQDRIKAVGHLDDKIRALTAELNQTKTRERYLKDIIDKSDEAYENQIAKLQIEINHLKHNK